MVQHAPRRRDDARTRSRGCSACGRRRSRSRDCRWLNPITRRSRRSWPSARCRAGATFSTTQLARIENPDRKARFEFVDAVAVGRSRPSASAGSCRSRTSTTAAASRGCSRDSGNLHHPLRAEASAKYVQPSLELLREIQQTGDIFFPDALDEHDALGPQFAGGGEDGAGLSRQPALVLSGAFAEYHPADGGRSVSRRRTSLRRRGRSRSGTKVTIAGFTMRTTALIVLAGLATVSAQQPAAPITIRAARVIDGQRRCPAERRRHHPRIDDRTRGTGKRRGHATISAR